MIISGLLVGPVYQYFQIFTRILGVGLLKDVAYQEGLAQGHKVDIYKVCLKHSGTLISSLGYELPGCIIYRIREPVVPISGYGPLCGFSNFGDARDYAKSLLSTSVPNGSGSGISTKTPPKLMFRMRPALMAALPPVRTVAVMFAGTLG